MRFGIANTIRRGFLCTAAFLSGGLAAFLLDQHAPSAAPAEWTVAEIIELRWSPEFPIEVAPTQLASFALAVAPERQPNLLQQGVAYVPQSIGDLPAPAVFSAPSEVPTLAAAQPPAAEPVAVKVATAEVPRRPSAAPAPRLASATAPPSMPSRPGAVLNDAQIAVIKQRLRLTPDQERMWPAVETALRNIAYKKERNATRVATTANRAAPSIDPASPEVQQLKSAAVPLVMSFNREQRQEVRAFAHIIGLQEVASQF